MNDAGPLGGKVTVAVVPRERYSTSERALESLLTHTPDDVPLIYVDAGSPRKIARYLKERSRERGIVLVREERHLSPNKARNAALPFVRTPYVVFIDNDAVVTPGWLEALVNCADDTGAWAVGPLYFEGDPDDKIIHVAGGVITVDETRKIATEHRLQGTRLADVGHDLTREPCDFVEFHCMLVRMDAFDKLGPLDEDLFSTREHLDLCMAIRSAGESVYMEPASEVTYTTPPPLSWYDIPFFLHRWSERWNFASLDHFYEKWDLREDVKRRAAIYRSRRHIVFQPATRGIRRVLGDRAAHYFETLVRRVEPPLNRRLFGLPR